MSVIGERIVCTTRHRNTRLTLGNVLIHACRVPKLLIESTFMNTKSAKSAVQGHRTICYRRSTDASQYPTSYVHVPASCGFALDERPLKYGRVGRTISALISEHQRSSEFLGDFTLLHASCYSEHVTLEYMEPQNLCYTFLNCSNFPTKFS